jgi:hypothetical protein
LAFFVVDSLALATDFFVFGGEFGTESFDFASCDFEFADLSGLGSFGFAFGGLGGFEFGEFGTEFFGFALGGLGGVTFATESFDFTFGGFEFG